MASTGLHLAFAASFVVGGVLGAGACTEKKTSETADAVAPVVAEAGMTNDADGGAGSDAAAAPTDAAAAPTDATSDAAVTTDGGARHATADAAGGGSSASASASVETGVRSGDAGSTVAAKASAIAIDESAAGKTIDLAPGQTLTLSLGANATSGFDWSVTKAPAALGTPNLTYVQGASQMGAAGTRKITWTLATALPAGEHPVELAYARSFEKGVAPFKTFKLKVRAAR